MSEHYVCTGGCQGVSDDPQATCQASDCANHTKPLVKCECQDSQHASVLGERSEPQQD